MRFVLAVSVRWERRAKLASEVYFQNRCEGCTTITLLVQDAVRLVVVLLSAASHT